MIPKEKLNLQNYSPPGEILNKCKSSTINLRRAFYNNHTKILGSHYRI